MQRQEEFCGREEVYVGPETVAPQGGGKGTMDVKKNQEEKSLDRLRHTEGKKSGIKPGGRHREEGRR